MLVSVLPCACLASTVLAINDVDDRSRCESCQILQLYLIREILNSSGEAGKACEAGDRVCRQAQANLLGNQAKKGDQRQSGLE